MQGGPQLARLNFVLDRILQTDKRAGRSTHQGTDRHEKPRVMLSASHAFGLPRWLLRRLTLLSILLRCAWAQPSHAQSAVVDIGAGTGLPGSAVDVTTTLSTSEGAVLAATINDITFYKRAMSLGPSDCRINPATAKSLSAFVVHDNRGARTLRVSVQSIFSPPPIHDGPLYTCTVHIAPTTSPGRYPLIISNARGFGPTGAELRHVSGTGGSVAVTIVLVPSATPSPSATPTPTPTPTQVVDPCPPDVILDPPAGLPGSQVMFSGRCDFVQSGRHASVYFDDALVATVMGDADGNYSGVLTIPADAPVGAHQINIVNPHVLAAAPFEVIAVPVTCAGDCNGDDIITIDEILQVVTIAFGDAAPDSCPSVDANGDGTATIDELLAAVRSALSGCSPSPG
jgi:hypothetical protein